MSSTKSVANGSVFPQASGRRSASFERHRRQNSGSASGGHKENGGVPDEFSELKHVRSPSGSSLKGKASGMQGMGSDARFSGAMPIGVVAPPPKERLLPSPPLTPVASLSSLRKTPGKDGSGEAANSDNATLTSGRSKSKEMRVASDRNDFGDDHDGAVEVDTEADGALSTWSYRPDGVTEGSTQEKTNADDDAGSTSALAHPSDVVAGPQSSSYNVPQGPTPPLEIRDPLRESDVEANTEAPSSYPQEFPSSAASSSSMPAGNETSSSTMPVHLHPLYNGPSPQPWDLVDPPPNNNMEMEDIMRRVRKDSSRSVPGASASFVVKDGKKYRIPHSSYYFGPPSNTSAFGTDPIGHIGVHHPREIVRVERDYSGGELAQFSPAYPLELEGRITPTQFLETINAVNETLIEAHSLRWSFLDNTLAVLTLYISRLFVTSHYDRKMKHLAELIKELNKSVYNPVGLNILWPKDVAFMFLEIEYY